MLENTSQLRKYRNKIPSVLYGTWVRLFTAGLSVKSDFSSESLKRKFSLYNHWMLQEEYRK